LPSETSAERKARSKVRQASLVALLAYPAATSPAAVTTGTGPWVLPPQRGDFLDPGKLRARCELLNHIEVFTNLQGFIKTVDSLEQLSFCQHGVELLERRAKGIPLDPSIWQRRFRVWNANRLENFISQHTLGVGYSNTWKHPAPVQMNLKVMWEPDVVVI